MFLTVYEDLKGILRMPSRDSLRMILTNSQREVCSLENSAGNSYFLRKGHGSLTHTNAHTSVDGMIT